MSQFLVRGLSAQTVAHLKSRARQHGRSLQAEVHNILEQAAKTEATDTIKTSSNIRKKLANRTHTDSTVLLAKDRSR